MRLRPHASSELVDTALRLYQRQGLTFLRLTALPALFCLAAFTFFIDYILPSFSTTRDSSSLGTQALEVVTTVLLGIFVAGPLFLTGLTYASSIIVRLASADMEGVNVDEIEAQRFARSALPRLFWLNLRELAMSSSGVLVAVGIMLGGSLLTSVTSEDSALAGLVALLGFLGLGIGALIFLMIVSWDALVVPITILEGVNGKQASKRSRLLLKAPKRVGFGAPVPSGYGPVWNIYLASFFVFFGVYLAISSVFDLLSIQDRLTSWLGGSIINSILSLALEMLPMFVSLWLIIPIWAASITVIYYERRVRLEGYDILRLASLTEDAAESRFSV